MVIVSGGVTSVSVIVNVRLAVLGVGVALSLTVRANVTVPAVVGVPESVAFVSVSPAGSVPLVRAQL